MIRPAMPYKVEHTLINHACASSETLERVFRRILYTNGGPGGGGVIVPGVPSGDRGNWD